MTAQEIMSSGNTSAATERYYKGYDARKGEGRNNLLFNPQILFQFLAAEAALVLALRSIAFLVGAVFPFLRGSGNHRPPEG